LDFKKGDRILTSRAEYGANYVAFLQTRKRTGCEIEVIPDDENGATDATALPDMIDGGTKLIAITWIPTNGGLINPAAEIGQVARAHGIPYLLDACQAVGQLEVDVNEIGCDFLTAAGRKWLRGPRGTGFLYVHREMLDRVEPGMIDHDGAHWTSPGSYELKGDTRRYEVFERAPALHLGLGAAADYALRLGLASIRERVDALARSLRSELRALPGISVRDLGLEKAGLVTFSHDRVPAGAINAALVDRNIHVSVSVPESTLLDSSNRALPELVRASPHYYNSEDEIEIFLNAIRDICAH
jgi:selenocysteine lyase/cysteine desulfurase